MASVVSICNLALASIGKPHINDLMESSEEARQCSRHYEPTRDILLQSYPWRFAEKRATLAEITNLWGQEFAYAYARPPDCLRILGVTSPYFDIPGFDASVVPTYTANANAILWGFSPATIEYIARVEDPGMYPPLFQEALYWALAAKIAMPLTRDQSVRKDAYQLAESALDKAKVADANEQPVTWVTSSEFIRARA